MNLKPLIPLALLALAIPAHAQGQQQTTGGSRNTTAGAAPADPGAGGDVRIAIANPSRIFAEMQETKDLKESLETERIRLTAVEKEKRDELQTLQNKRNQYKADSPQFDEHNTKLMDAALEFQLWGQQTKAKAERMQKRQMKHLFQRIEVAVSAVAEREGFDLVVADQRPELPENLDQINFDQLRALINTRNVLFASARADITDLVISELDAQYKRNGGAGSGPGGAVGTSGGGGGGPLRKPAQPQNVRPAGGGGGAAPAGKQQ